MSTPPPAFQTNVAFPNINTPLAMTGPDMPSSGGPTSPWYRFFTTLWTRTGGQQGINGAALTQASSDQALLIAMNAQPIGDGVPLPIVITPGASPYSYQAPFRGTVLINGGTVSAISFCRDGSTQFAFPTGVIPVFTGDVVTVTYSGAPSMTMIGS